MTRTRETKLTVWLAEAEMAMLNELAERTGLSKSDVIRQLVRREHAGTEPKPSPKPTRRKTRQR
jgi:hypothetical protein